MPIIGLTNRGLAFPEIGQIRKGAKKTENRPGADLTYFRVEFDEQEKQARADFMKVYGPTPSEIRAILPFNEIEKEWDAWYEAYTAGRMVARSDGQYIQYQLDEHGDILVKNGYDLSGARVPHPADGIAGKDYNGRPVKFKASGRLKVIIPDLSRAAYVTLLTTSIHDIGNISDQLSAFKELNHGQIAGIPLTLRRRPKSISMPKSETDHTRVRRVKWLISIEADPVWVKAKLAEVRALATPQMEANLLPAQIEQIDAADIELDDDDVTDFEQENEGGETTQPETVIELVEVMGSWAVQYAAEKWGCKPSEAAPRLVKMNLGKTIAKSDFIQIISNPGE